MNNITIVKILNSSDTGIIENITFLLLLFGVATNLLIAIGKDNVAITINKEKVGINKLYKPKPSVPKYLEIIILKINPRNLDKKPPVNKINVEAKNLFLNNFLIIFKYMRKHIKKFTYILMSVIIKEI